MDKKELIKEIYSLSISIWYEVFKHHAIGHPGISGPSSVNDEGWDEELGTLIGIKAALTEIVNKIKD